MLFLIFMFCIALSLSYFLLWLIYRKALKSKKKISKFLVFLGWIGLIIFFYTPYSYYLEPSYWKFRGICKLDTEIYQFNGGKIDEEYYNKVLKYFDTSLNKLDWEYIRENLFFNRGGEYLYKFERYYDRINFTFFIVFKNERAERNNIDYVWSHTTWDNYRMYLTGNEGSGFYLSDDWEDCGYFKRKHKGVKNDK